MNTPSNPTAGFSGVYDNPTYLEPFDLGGISFRPVELLEHLLITGATGSGKTRALLMPMIEQILRRFGTDDDQKAGLFLIDAKGDMSQLAVECARRAGRGDDVFILGEGGNCWFPLFELFGGDATRVANFLFEILEDRTSRGALNRGGSNDSYWEENSRRLLRAACTLAKAEHGLSMGGLNGISCAANQILACNASRIDDEDGYANSTHLNSCEVKAKEGRAAGKLTQAEFTEFFANDCPQTSEYFERIGGLEDRKVESLSYSPRIAPARFRLPNHRFVNSAKMRMEGKTISDQRVAKFSAAELGRLPNGSAFVVNKGRTLARFTLNPADYAGFFPSQARSCG